MEKENGTDLFVRPSREYHHSEHFWSSFFALYILESSRSGEVILKAKKHTKENRFCDDGELNITSKLKFDDLIVEGNIGDVTFFKKVGFNKTGFQEEYLSIKPDIVIRDTTPTKEKVIIIEVKTVGHKIGRYQKILYEKLIAFLRENGCAAELYFLLSSGHENNRDWDLLTEGEKPSLFKLLLWEDVFKKISEQKMFNWVDFGKYTEI